MNKKKNSSSSNGLPQLWLNVNKVKNDLKYTLSDPLRRCAVENLKEACDQAAATVSANAVATSVRKTVAELSSHLTVPNFLKHQQRQQQLLHPETVNNASTTRSDGNAAADDDQWLTDDSLECQENLERETIIEKYEKGPEKTNDQGTKSDDERTDRYGFVLKDTEAASAMKIAEKKRREKENSRLEKWHLMLYEALIEKMQAEQKQEDRNIRGVPEMRIVVDKKMVEKSRRERGKMHSRVWKGIPERWRSEAWIYLLQARKLKRETERQFDCPNLYNNLLMRAKLVSKDIKQIDLDINRTYRDHVDFRKRYGIGQKSLLSVLAAYAVFNTEVGYCQGMSQIAALFLMYMNEEDAFWCLHSLLVDNRYSMHGFFVPGFPKLLRFQAHYEKILQRYLPRVKKHLDRANIPPIYLTKWWFGCYLDRVPFTLALRLWDVFLSEGDAVLMAMAYNIMKMHQKSIRKLQIEDFMNYIQTTIAVDFGYSDEEVMHSLEECLRRLQADHMDRPLSPPPGDNPEKPKIKFGPVLARSMFDIREGIREMKNRHSRANSVAGRSPGLSHQLLAPPSPSLLRSRLINTLGVEEEPEFPSSSSASTIRSVKDINSNGQSSLQSSHSDRLPQQNNTHLSQLEKPNVNAHLPQHLVHEVVPNPSSSTRKPQMQATVQPVSSEASKKLVPGKTTRYDISPMVTARYRTLPPDRIPDKEGGVNAATKNSLSNKRDVDERDAVELSRGSQIKKYRSPPEPAIDYELSPKLWQDTATPSKFSALNNSYGRRPYQPESTQHMSSEHRIRSPPKEEWSAVYGNAERPSASRSYPVVNENRRRSRGTQEGLYDNLEDNSSQNNYFAAGGGNHNKQFDMRGIRGGEVHYSARRDERPGNSRHVYDYSDATTQPNFVSRGYGAHLQKSIPSDYQKYTTEIETRVTKAPNNVTIVSVGDEGNSEPMLEQQFSKPLHNNGFYKSDNGGTHRMNEQRFRYGNDRLERNMSPFRTSPAYYDRNIRGGWEEIFNMEQKFVTSERHYPPYSATNLHYHSTPAHSHPPASNYFSNRLRF